MFDTPSLHRRDSTSLNADQNIGYCDLDNLSKSTDLRNHQDQQRENSRDRRSHPRVDLHLPAECQARGTLKPFGGIVIDGSEGGFLIFSTKEISVGAVLKIIVFFPVGYELDGLEVLAEVIRRNAYHWETAVGYEYGLRFTRVEGKDLKKLRWLLSNQMAPEEASREFHLELSLQA